MNAELEYYAPCLFGLEGVLAGEARRLGFGSVRAENGSVTFTGPAMALAKANLWLRTAERVNIVVGRFTAVTFDELFEGAKALPWEDWIAKDDAFPVVGHSLKSKLHSVPDCQAIIKKAVADRLGGRYGLSWLAETGSMHRIRFSIMDDAVMLMLDTSGEGLHKRGYRPAANMAPIRETLAAGILDIARYKHFERLCDPMCGSGTIAIEAALRASNAAPGLNRSFLCESWPQLPRSLFSEARAEARAAALSRPLEIVASDIDRRAVALTRENARRAGVAQCLRVECRDVSALSLPAEGENVIVCNPPYGERMSELGEVRALCETMGKAFERQMHRRAYIITAYDDFERAYGRRADKNRKLYNGMIRTYLYQYFK